MAVFIRRLNVAGCVQIIIMIIMIMHIDHALINALSAHVIHINTNIIFYTHVEQSYQSYKVLY